MTQAAVTPPRVELLVEDPELGASLTPERFQDAATAARVPLVTLPAGTGGVAEQLPAGPGALGWLVLEGLLLRSVVLDGATFVELIGPGDVIFAHELHPDEELVRHRLQTEVHSTARLAALDRRFTEAAATWPELLSALFDRAARRSTRLSLGNAISNHPRVDERLVGTLWLVAERWGKVTPEGLLVDLRLSHDTLGRLIGAQRSTVTKALGALEERGTIRRRPDGRIILVEEGAPADIAAMVRRRLVRDERRYEREAERLHRRASDARDELAELDKREGTPLRRSSGD